MKGDYVLDYHTCYLSFLNSTSEKIEGNTVSCCYLLKRSFAEAFRRWLFHIIWNSQRRTQIHSKSLKKPPLRQKDDYTPQAR